MCKYMSVSTGVAWETGRWHTSYYLDSMPLNWLICLWALCCRCCVSPPLSPPCKVSLYSLLRWYLSLASRSDIHCLFQVVELNKSPHFNLVVSCTF
ncbi:hypothetical protein ANANG_G00248240 [Anguilla anguilla]|uniref:Uncharacterized protein n=1 Tax=Anguilla anguilla TaxID=7936 RepID=A0A9D3LT74_ANGAN|nr:hypothetical protein ANANG_G00248240 [Anguilla anguilla]